MADRDWDKELSKVDKQLESVADEQLFPTSRAKTPAQREEVAAIQRRTSTFGVFARLTLTVALGVGILFWPYAARCGAGLAAYLGAVGVLAGAGVWSAVWTWRHRSGNAHVLSLLIMLWGVLLGAIEVLPRIGYAKPTPSYPAIWACR